MFEGSFVAIVTPFKNEAVDEYALRRLIEFQIANGTQGIVPCGTTGESATLTHEEHDQVIAIAVEACAGKVPVLAGTGSNSTFEAIKLTQHAEKAGADGSLLITPYYNKPSQEGLYRHFETVAKETDLPIILYNVPGRTSVNMLPETVERLSKIRNIVGIKEASGSLTQITEVIARCGEDFSVISGDDPLLLPILSVGGKGVISVTANVLPAKVAQLCGAAMKGDMETARKLHHELFRLNEAMFVETNPVPVKKALHLMGWIEDEVRQPLAPLTESSLNFLKKIMSDYSLH
ncbi:MAG: 4-hydroxy-tetrahydrodipicolinate synthase [Candidatus Nitrohelix vancouverensis]|uniref:4-hydroxy-tetrahydrodipicolinate synthase n=1 Tax=Candidatus Nitrohelix vancouverensis TaxID=2705534 RepID=A0A7T0C0N5_9BACT|nr:MAG: 4-hydroxy-tetrahydrodipicolinate synthase [Candidatus Nitrohelix vancouverensis]